MTRDIGNTLSGVSMIVKS